MTYRITHVALVGASLLLSGGLALAKTTAGTLPAEATFEAGPKSPGQRVVLEQAKPEAGGRVIKRPPLPVTPGSPPPRKPSGTTSTPEG